MTRLSVVTSPLVRAAPLLAPLVACYVLSLAVALVLLLTRAA